MSTKYKSEETEEVCSEESETTTDELKSTSLCSLTWVLHLTSNFVFVVASAIYIWLAVLGLQYVKDVDPIPDDVLNAEDDVTWFGYVTESQEIPDNVMEATDDATWYAWYLDAYNEVAPEYPYVFDVNTYQVSQYQAVYFAAALGFLITGFLDLFLYSGLYKLLGGIMMLAAAFGLVSAMLIETDNHLALVFNSVSVHIFLLEAVAMVVRRRNTVENAGSFTTGLLYLGGACWVVGIILDVVISYIALYGGETMRVAIMGVFAACMWLTCALLYTSVSLILFFGQETT